MQTMYPPSAKRRATAAPIASPAPTRRATPFDFDMSISRTSDLIRRDPHDFVRDHPVDGAIAVAELAKNLVGMLADAWRGASDRRFIDLKPCRRLRLPYPSDHRLIELRDDVARHDLRVMDDLAAAQDRRAGNVGCVEPFQPFGGGMPSDVLRHLVDPRGGVERSLRWRCKTRILGELGIAGSSTKSLPFGIRNGAGGEVAVAGLEHEIGPVVGIGGYRLGSDHRVLHHAFRP